MKIPKDVTRLKTRILFKEKNILPDETFRVYKDDVASILNCQLSVLGIRAR